jgi:quinol monooxygenase YgiN
MEAVRVAVLMVLVVVGIGVLFAAEAAGQDKPNPIVARVKEDLKDPSRPFVLLVRLEAKEGMGDKLEAAFAKAVPLTKREKGCLNYDLSRDAKAPNRYLLYERWQDLPSLDAHLKSAHIATLLKEVNDVRSAPPELQVLIPVE